MDWITLAVVATPALAAAIVWARSKRPTGADAGAARPVAVWASGLVVVAAVVLFIEVSFNGATSMVATDGEGRAVLGLVAGRVEASLVLLTSLVGWIVQAFAARSLVGDDRAARFHTLALVLVASTNLTALAASGLTFAAGWIATSVVVAGLIGHRRGWRAADEAVRRTRATLAIGDLALLAGVVVATVSAGHLDLRALDDVVTQVDSTSGIAVIAVLLVIGGMARSAIVPFSGWLPATLAAPTPVSALLHAGVVNGAGVLIIRFHPLMVESSAPFVLAFVAGAATAVVATAIMIVRTDTKGGLVWSTVGQMGFMVAQLGAGAFAAAFFHLIGHAMYKAAAFLGAGDAIGARSRREFRPAKHGAASFTSVAMSSVIAAGSVAAALLVLDPHLTDTAVVLVATFATLTIARALHGWIVTAAFAPGVVVPAAAAGGLAAAFAYVGGLKLVEGFVVDEVPFEVANAVSAPWIIAALAGVAAGWLIVTRLPGAAGTQLRTAVYVRLIGFGASSAPTAADRPGRPRRSAAVRAESRAPTTTR